MKKKIYSEKNFKDCLNKIQIQRNKYSIRMDDSTSKQSVQRHESNTKEDDFKEISDFFESHSFDKIEKWLVEHAPPEVLSKISSITTIGKCSNSHRSSVTSELFQQWLTTSPSKVKFTRQIH